MNREERTARAEQMRREYEAGASTTKLAAKHGTSVEGVRRAIIRVGGKMRARGAPKTAEIYTLDAATIEAVLADCERHMTAAEIAERHGLHVWTVYKVCAGRLKPKRIRGDARARQTAACVHLFDRGHGLLSIGRLLGMPHMRAKKLLLEAGVEMRPPGCRHDLERRRASAR